MRTYLVLTLFASGLALTRSDSSVGAWDNTYKSPARLHNFRPAELSERITVQAAGRGNAYINFGDGRDIITSYSGPQELLEALETNQAKPLSLSSADFDGDGVADLISGYAGPNGGIVILQRGNADSIHPNSPEAQDRKARGTFTDSPFLSPGRSFALPEAADFLGCGDFDADGRFDLIAAARGGDRLYFLAGDGEGAFSNLQQVELPGRVSSMVTGEINRRDGLTDLAVGIATDEKSSALVFEGPEGALRSTPEFFHLPAQATALAIGPLVDADQMMDLAVAAGSQLLVIHGRDRKLSLDEGMRAAVHPAIVNKRSLPFVIRSLAVGKFTSRDESGIALLADDGAVHLLTQPNLQGKRQPTGESLAKWQRQSMMFGRWPNAEQLVRAKLSNSPTDDLVLVDSASRQLHVIPGPRQRDTQHVFAASDSWTEGRAPASLDVEGEPAAVLPLRLNGDAFDDLALLRAGAVAPSVVLSVPNAIITVNSPADTNARDSVLTLREAILLANGELLKSGLTAAEQAQVSGTPAPGLDEIRFNIPAGLQGNQTAPLDNSPAVLSKETQAERVSILPASFTASLVTSDLPSFLLSMSKRTGTLSSSPTLFSCDTRPFPEILAPVGVAPNSSAVGDFNGDGKPDLAVANAGSNSVSILLGTGAGTFSPATNLAVGPHPVAVVTADFNNDGKLDLAVSNSNSDFLPGSISLLLGTGTGGFGADTQFPVGIFPAAVAVGDFDGDSRLDIAVANLRSGSVSILIGKVTGGFGTATDFAVGSNPSSIAVGDFNGDVKLDLAVANNFSDSVSVLLGTGTGSFGAATNFAVSSRPVSIAVADFNGDSKLDIVTANNSDVSVLRGTGTGGFNILINFPLSSTGSFSSSNSLVVGDFTGDSKLDVIVVKGNSTSFSLLGGTGTGLFNVSTVNLTLGSQPNSVAAGDFNGDGKLDLVVTNSGSACISILFGTGTGSFSTVTTNFAVGNSPQAIAAGDFNGDNKIDIAVATGSGVSILLGTGTGTFGAQTTFAAGSSPAAIAVGDFSGDGKLDLAVAGGSGVSILLGTGTGSFGAATSFAAGAGPFSVEAGDFNSDNKLDLAVANIFSNNVSVLLGAGTGSFGAATNFAVGGQPASVALGDFNTDNKLDLAVANNSSGNVSILLGTGTGNFDPATNFPAGSSSRSLAVGDFNGDGIQDLVVVRAGDGAVVILYGAGEGFFSAPTSFATGLGSPVTVVAADFNGDGRPDVAAPVQAFEGAAVLLADGMDGFIINHIFPAGSGPNAMAVADFNGDGKPDLAVSNSGSNDVSIILNSCTVAPDLTVAKTHAGNFTVGTNATYNLTVNNIGGGATTGPMTVTDTLPSGLGFVSGSGAGWSCSAVGQTVTCTNPNTLASGASSGFSLTVSVAIQAAPSVTNTASVSTAGEVITTNNSTSDPTNVFTVCNVTPLTVGQTVNGALANTDCRSPIRGANDTFADRYSFTGAANQQVAITLASTAFDAFLYLIGPDSAVLVADDDGAGGTDSRIPATTGFFTLPASGTYIIEATSFGSGRTGNYTLGLTTGQANCTYNISPSVQSYNSSGGSGTVAVTTAPGCSWVATSNASFLMITAGANGSGNGSVSYAVANNPGVLGRSGTLTIAGQTFTVTQSASAVCSFTINPTSQSFTATGGNGTISVTTSAGCNWTAVSNAGFITLTPGAGGNGNGSVSYTVASNSTGNPRTGTVTVAGQVFTVNQSTNLPNATTITLVSPLPKITDPITIDGTTQPGFTGAPVIEINGTNLKNAGGGNGLTITAGSSTIRGLAINRFASLNRDSDILLITNGNNIVEGCYLGSDASGTVGFTPSGTSATSVGVSMRGSSGNRIGGTTAAARNLISGVDGSGIIVTSGSTGNLIQGNFIGTDVTGSFSLGFQRVGVYVQGASGNTIGGTATGAGNLISGNLDYGVFLQDDAQNNLVQGNLIGSNSAGTNGVPNGNAGVFVYNPSGASAISLNSISGVSAVSLNNTIGGTTTLARNIISGNDPYGVALGAGATGTLVQGNYIGTDATGGAALANTYGVTVTQATASSVGGAVAGARNIISGNSQTGVSIGFLNNGQTGGTGTTIQGNFIGTTAAGTAALGNGRDGVFLEVNTTAHAIRENTIAFNGANGVRIPDVTANPGAPGVRIEMVSNSIYSNTALGIDLGATGETANDARDPDTGANLVQNYPVLTSATTVGSAALSSASFGPAATGTIRIQGNLNSTPNTGFYVQFFSLAECSGSNPQGNQQALNFVPILFFTDASGNAAIDITFPNATILGGWVNALARDPRGNTSAFSQCIQINNPTGCSFSIGPDSQPFASNGGAGSVSVTAGAGCVWTAVSNDDFIIITAGPDGTGNGSVSYQVTANPGSAQRIGTMAIAGKTFTVTQQGTPAPCSFSISPASQNFGASGGSGGFNVTSQSGCNWTAYTDVGWISTASSGAGSGAVSYLVEDNVSGPRTGHITVADKVYTVTQDGAAVVCGYSLSSHSAVISAAGASASFDLTTGPGCFWNGAADVAWIIVPFSGTGSAQVDYTVLANPGPPRTGSIYIADRIFTVTQQGSACTYSIAPGSQGFTASGGAGSVNVTAGFGCGWMAVSNAPGFIKITSGSNGSGNGTVSFSVAPNPGADRAGTMTIAGQTFTVTQPGNAADTDQDGIPDVLEPQEGKNPNLKDNDIFTSNRLFVQQQYRDFLSREADPDGIAYWTGVMGQGVSRAQVIDNFFNSAEFQGSIAPIARLYFSYFLRIPDYGGVLFWADAFRSGQPLHVISGNFAQSAEFQQRYGTLDNTQFVILVYQNVLGRTPSQVEIDFWVTDLNAGRTTKGLVMLGFSESEEFKAKMYNEVYVTMMYAGMLKRGLAQVELDFWVDLMDDGISGLQLIENFLPQAEYRNRFLPPQS